MRAGRDGVCRWCTRWPSAPRSFFTRFVSKRFHALHTRPSSLSTPCSHPSSCRHPAFVRAAADSTALGRFLSGVPFAPKKPSVSHLHSSNRRHPAHTRAAASTPPAPDRRLTPHPHPNDCQHLAHTRLPADISSAPDRQPTSCLHLSPLPFQQSAFLPNSGIFFVCWYVEGRFERLSHCKFTQTRGMLHIILILE